MIDAMNDRDVFLVVDLVDDPVHPASSRTQPGTFKLQLASNPGPQPVASNEVARLVRLLGLARSMPRRQEQRLHR